MLKTPLILTIISISFAQAATVVPAPPIIQEHVEKILPLLLAMGRGDHTTLDHLLTAGADPNTCYPINWNKNTNFAITQESAISIITNAQPGDTLLTAAVAARSYTLVACLLRHNANITKETLFKTVPQKHDTVAEETQLHALLEQFLTLLGPAPKSPNAHLRDIQELLDLILQHAKIKNKNYAAWVQCIVQAPSFSFKGYDKSLVHPLFAALLRADFNVIEALLRTPGCDVNVQRPDTGNTPLQQLLQRQKTYENLLGQPITEIIDLLKAHGGTEPLPWWRRCFSRQPPPHINTSCDTISATTQSTTSPASSSRTIIKTADDPAAPQVAPIFARVNGNMQRLNAFTGVFFPEKHASVIAYFASLSKDARSLPIGCKIAPEFYYPMHHQFAIPDSEETSVIRANDTLPSLACRAGQTELLTTLLAYGINLHADYGLIRAAIACHYQPVILLYFYGGKINAKHNGIAQSYDYAPVDDMPPDVEKYRSEVVSRQTRRRSAATEPTHK